MIIAQNVKSNEGRIKEEIQQTAAESVVPKPTAVFQEPEKGSVGADRGVYQSKQIALGLLPDYDWENQWGSLEALWTAESGWQAGRLNKSSFACGIPQALPCTKIYSNFASMEQVLINGKLFLKNPDAEKEIKWGLEYIKKRYGTPYKAYQFFLAQSPHWY